MDKISFYGKADHFGVLHLDLPVGLECADKELLITVEPLETEEEAIANWRKGIIATAGTWQGDFIRPEQGDYEVRQELN